MLIVLMGCGVAGALLLRPAADKGVEIADEWKTRLEADYPGWEPVGFNFRTFQGPSGTETAYQFTLVPPGENLSVPVLYLAVDDGPAESQDEVFRPAARHHERADALLEYIDDTYYQNGKSVTAVTSDIMGKVTVEWLEVKRFGPFSSRYGSYDELRYDDAREAWIKIQR